MKPKTGVRIQTPTPQTGNFADNVPIDCTVGAVGPGDSNIIAGRIFYPFMTFDPFYSI